MQTKLITLTAGSIKNTYVGTALIADLIPDDAIGGSNKTQRALKTISVDYGGGLVSHTDVDGTKQILRDRKTFSAFIKRHLLQEGDQVSVTRIGSHALKVESV
jgi:hypothetical protein